MSKPRVGFTAKSSNKKTGPIPVTTTQSSTCPTSCPLMYNGCYAKGGPLAIFWRRIDKGTAGYTWEDFLARVRELPDGTLWRHNQAGDLPGDDLAIDQVLLDELVQANTGKRGFTYTHKPPTASNANAIKAANDGGFAVNLSGNNLVDADALFDLGIAPVVTLLDKDQTTNVKTPKGRTVVVCPATQNDTITCSTCKLCSVIDRPSIVGFPAHGSSKRKVSSIANDTN